LGKELENYRNYRKHRNGERKKESIGAMETMGSMEWGIKYRHSTAPISVILRLDREIHSKGQGKVIR